MTLLQILITLPWYDYNINGDDSELAVNIFKKYIFHYTFTETTLLWHLIPSHHDAVLL